MSAFEYRLRWRRQGRNWSPSVIRQTEHGVTSRIEKMLALDRIVARGSFYTDADLRDADAWPYGGGTVIDFDEEAHEKFRDLPPIVEYRITRRPVGDWTTVQAGAGLSRPDLDENGLPHVEPLDYGAPVGAAGAREEEIPF